jgi:hypothetical protein
MHFQLTVADMNTDPNTSLSNIFNFHQYAYDMKDFPLILDLFNHIFKLQ